MSNHSEYEKEQLEIEKAQANTQHYNFEDLDPEGELNKQFAALRKKDRVMMLIAGMAAGLLLTIGVGYYVADAQADFADPRFPYGYQAGYSDSSGTGSAQYAVAGSTGAAGGGGCCGGGAGASAGGGGGCGGGGSALGSTSLPDLEKQALAEYTKETGAKDVTAKASDFGCHIQMDISDKAGKIVRSYGYQGGALYVIK